MFKLNFKLMEQYKSLSKGPCEHIAYFIKFKRLMCHK